MKKFVLDKGTGELVPWSEFVHEKVDDNNSVTVNQAGNDEGEKKLENLEKKASEEEIENVEKIDDLENKSTSQIVEELKEEKSGDDELDKVVIKKTDADELGPPGIRPTKKRAQKRPRKRAPKLEIVTAEDYDKKSQKSLL